MELNLFSKRARAGAFADCSAAGMCSVVDVAVHVEQDFLKCGDLVAAGGQTQTPWR
jgi:hypothetical protein